MYPLQFNLLILWIVAVLLWILLIFLTVFFSINQGLLIFLFIGAGIILFRRIFNIQHFVYLTTEQTFLRLFPWLIILLLIRFWLLTLYYIPTDSMQPTLRKGDLIVATPKIFSLCWFKHYCLSQQMKVGDVIVFKDKKNKKKMIKRVIGIPGDVISVRRNVMMLNGKIVSNLLIYENSYIESDSLSIIVALHQIKLFKQYLRNYHFSTYRNKNPNRYKIKFIEDSDCRLIKKELKCFIPQNKYFVLGDNQDNSLDSRYFGLIEEKSIQGKAQFILFNIFQFNRFFNPII